MEKTHLSIDIETRSSVDIQKSGAYRYAQQEDFEILLFAYKYGNGGVDIIDLKNGEKIPYSIIHDLEDPCVIKHAYNAAFEWYCLNQAGYKTPIGQWECTMVHGMYCGYPAGLGAAGKAVGLPEDKQKLSIGKALIRYFCVPAKTGRRWNEPWHDRKRWELFKEYCKQDVVTEYSILQRLEPFPMPEREEHLWQMDILMNAYGVRADRELVDGALYIDSMCRSRLDAEAKEITGLANPNSTAQLQGWLEEKLGNPVENLQKGTVEELLNTDLPDDVGRVLKIRQQLGKTSVKKYAAVQAAMGADGRVRGISQFYGASRTGRWAGRLVQMQNLPRTYIGNLSFARKLVKSGNYSGLKLLYGNVPDTLSQLVRTAFIPSEGHKFVVADFSAIEARVIAWLACEQWVNEVFATHGKIYEAAASQMFHVPVEKITKGNPEYALRAKGKVATLALGYQGGVNSLVSMGALSMGLKEDELPDIVHRWRTANRRIVDLWYSVEDAVIFTMQTGGQSATHGLFIALEGDLAYGQSFLTVKLPCGRKLYYPRPFLQENRFGKPALHYYSGQQGRKWEPVETYGGKLTENIVQAIARDCLAEILLRLEEKGLKVVFHVHDEVIVDAPMEVTVEELCGLMSEPVWFAPGLVLKGAGFEGMYYRKD